MQRSGNSLFSQKKGRGFGFPFPIVLAFILRVCARKGSSVRRERGRIKDSAVPKTEREGEWEEGRGGEKKAIATQLAAFLFFSSLRTVEKEGKT